MSVMGPPPSGNAPDRTDKMVPQNHSGLPEKLAGYAPDIRATNCSNYKSALRGQLLILAMTLMSVLLLSYLHGTGSQQPNQTNRVLIKGFSLSCLYLSRQ